MVPPVLFLPARAGGMDFSADLALTRFAASRYAGWEAEDLPAVKVFCPKRGSRWRDCRPRASNFAALHPAERVCGNILEPLAAKCHKIYNDIIPHCTKIVNSYLFK